MSIQHLPENVIAQIKSSTTITSLNAVVCGLIKNSLDAGATKITVSVDYIRGNCSVEDNGLGIPPSEFKPAGGLGKLHYTSKFPAHNNTHGRHGAFLASVAALSLLSITSHHHGYHSHNSIKIHNSEVLARHTPSLPEQRLLSFPHGTRTTVRDLFGSMPVRVKQRAIDAERGIHAKDWERVKRSLVALLLAWPGHVSMSLRNSVDGRAITIRIPEEPLTSQDSKYDILSFTTRVSRTLFQAQLCDDRSRDLWVPLKASAGPVSVVGAVSLVPVATRHVQFISIGVWPVFNDHGSNILYEEINRLFANSSFGVEEDGEDLNEDERNRRAKDRRFKTDGYTNQELRGRKGVDRWPMFYIKINLEEQTSRVSEWNVEEILDERHDSLKAIVDILTAVIYEFLKANHFRPRYSRPRRVTSSRHSNSRDSCSNSPSGSSTPRADSGSDQTRASRNDLSLGDLASTRLHLASSTSRLRPDSPFNSWTRIKSGQPQFVHLHEKAPLGQEGAIEAGHSHTPTTLESGTLNDNIFDTPLIAPDGTLLRIPFPDVEMDSSEINQKHASGEESLGEEQPQLLEGEEVSWVNPTTKEAFAIDARTGLVIRSLRNKVNSANEAAGDALRLPLRKRLRSNTKPVPKDERSQWLGDLLSSWDNPVFHSQEPPIPLAFDEERALALVTAGPEGHYHGCNPGSLDAIQAVHSVEGRLSKDSLRNAEVIAQIDRKFIFVKIPLSSSPPGPSTDKEVEASLLVIIDQHAADERCRVEALMKDYFAIVEDVQTTPTGKCRNLIRARTELLEKPIFFDISKQDSHQFERSAEYFKRWGIVFQVSSSKSKPGRKGAAKLTVLELPPSIAERCRSEPRLLIELLRKEGWKFDEQGYGSSQSAGTETVKDGGDNRSELHWLARLHGCPQAILDMINSRACRSSIMFNDQLSHDECVDLVERLASCALPFQCAHGRPSMVPLVDLGNSPMSMEDVGKHKGSFGKEFKRWKSSRGG
ncbi:hypothetical protein F5Y06DRAFT_255328 [Hypoxylon sp. FL0890]|nr:hypothetical protein F5Y06DRAFT_255328 [Hypoxylon sp. FL0890]